MLLFQIRDIANSILNRELDRQFDLVLILEYFDESLILLQNLMCWSTEDLVYLKQNERISKGRFNSVLPVSLCEHVILFLSPYYLKLITLPTEQEQHDRGD